MPSWSSSEYRLIGGKIEHFHKCERRLTVQSTTTRKNREWYENVHDNVQSANGISVVEANDNGMKMFMIMECKCNLHME
ncbi:hypothetical protein Tco_0459716 [Tanacetum coccineum]